MSERNAQNLLDALSYTSGTNITQFGFDPRYDSFKIRGIDLTYTGVFKDGLRQANSPNGLFRLEPYGLEGISILKGPSSALYGASGTGGLVDLITKRPQEENLREVILETGSYKRLQTAFDFSGAIKDDSSLLYRLTGVLRHANTSIGPFMKDNRFYIAPAFTWQPDNDTKFTVLGSYMDATTGGTAAYVNLYDPVTRKSTGATHDYVGDPRFNNFRQHQGNIGYELDQRLNDAVIVHQRLRYAALANKYEYAVQGLPGYVEERNNNLATDIYLEAGFDTGAIHHKLITGLDAGRTAYVSDSGSGNIPFTPQHMYKPEITNRDRQTQIQTGIYAQDQLEMDAWRVTLGLRHDWLQSHLTTGSFADGFTRYKRNDHEITGRASIGYAMDNGLMPYLSYATSFVANAGILQSKNGSPREQAAPTTGRQFELGVKYLIPETQTFINAAIYNIDQKNASVYETSSGINEQIQLDMRSRGFEIDAGTTFDNGLSLQASYSYNDVKILHLTQATSGKTLNASPYHTASLWADYDIGTGVLSGLKLGAGIRYVGASFGDNVHTASLNNKAQLFIDANLRYDLANLHPKLENMQLQVNASNLLNQIYQSCTSGYCYWSEGRKITASMRYSF